MKRLLLLITLVASYVSYSQQLPQYSQYNRNQIMINPGAAGMYDFLDVTLGGRMQWVGFTDAPNTACLYASTVLPRDKARYNPALRTSNGPVSGPKVNTGRIKHGLAGQVVADQYGAFRDLSASVIYAIHLPISPNYNISFGTKLGISNSTFLQDRVLVLSQMSGYKGPTVNDNTYNSYMTNQSNLNFMDIGAGLFFYGDGVYLGVSADQLTTDMIRFGSGTTNFDPRTHLNVTGGYRFNLNDHWTLMPSVLVKYMAPAPLSLEGSLQLEYKEWIWLGASYRHTDALVGMIGCNLSDKFKIGYSYDFSVSAFNNYSVGGHELILGLMIGR